MAYLLPTEYEAYGLSAETADAWAEAASAMVDAYCRRKTLDVQTYTERMRMHPEKQVVWLSYLPVLELTEVRARFARACGGYAWGDEVTRVFGLSGQWTEVDVTTVEIRPETGELRLPQSVLGQVFGEVEVIYTSGYPEIPSAIKTAVAQIVRNAEAMPALQVKSQKLDAMQVEYFSASLLDEMTKSLLRPYVAERLG
ncbi:hypothetical protein [Terriglobus tenax]|uniref:hypothetical protein n=1 Tax=Terriglobus tenax TaxID=1111115 RepID=UPI0021E017CB|nr:hypothetical protein [Terriglobus tenax]